MVKWDDGRHDFEPDGALRDIYVTDATPQVWDRALLFMLGEGRSRYSIDETDAPPPATASDALRVWPDRAPLLIVERHGIEYACHFSLQPTRSSWTSGPKTFGDRTSSVL